jgi:formylmethanofuran dehydrogenase subunit E
MRGLYMDIPEDLQKVAEFHGHLCPGLAIGYRAAIEALRELGLSRAYDEELVCVVENDSCSVDAVQYLTGCTFGKGNLIFKDYGKQVFTFASRSRPGKGLRISLRPDIFSSPGEEADASRRREEVLERLLTARAEELFYLDRVDLDLPEEARIVSSEPCSNCGEPTMRSRLVERNGKLLCIPCSQGWSPPSR